MSTIFNLLASRPWTPLLAVQVLIMMRGLAAALALCASGTDALAETQIAGNWTREVFAERLDRPQAIAPWGADAVLVSERSGRVLLLKEGGERSDLGKIEVNGMNIFYVPESPYTEGVKDLVAIPGQNDSFLWCATTGDEQKIGWALGRAKVRQDQGQITMVSEVVWQSEPQRWIRSSPPPFSGCKIVVDGQMALVAMGANSRFGGSGRVVRVAMSGGKEAKVVSTGHRNPSGLLIRSGVLWEIEHGPAGGDELNLIVENGDYGWPEVSKGEPDDANHGSFLRSRPPSIDPVATWTPAIAPSSLAEFQGRLIVGSLKGGVLELSLDDANRVISQRRIIESIGRVRVVRATSYGKTFWLLTDGPMAKLFRIKPDGR